MIKCEVTKQFSLKDFHKIKNLVRARCSKEGELYVGDTFECDEEMARYLYGENEKCKVVVKIIEVIPKQGIS